MARRVLVRLRARIDRVPRWRRQSPDERVASVNVKQAAFAVTSDADGGVPVAFGEVSRTGETRFFYSSRCE